jgi:hypothetical protein
VGLLVATVGLGAAILGIASWEIGSRRLEQARQLRQRSQGVYISPFLVPTPEGFMAGVSVARF